MRVRIPLFLNGFRNTAASYWKLTEAGNTVALQEQPLLSTTHHGRPEGTTRGRPVAELPQRLSRAAESTQTAQRAQPSAKQNQTAAN